MCCLAEVFDTDSSGEVDFTEFITGMSTFSTQADMESKLRFAFKIYDIDNDGYISNKELFQVSFVVCSYSSHPRNFTKAMFLIGFTNHGGQ